MAVHKQTWKRVYFLSMVILTSMLLLLFFIISPIHIKSKFSIHARKDKKHKLHLFKPVITEEEKNAFRTALQVFNEAVRMNVTYFLYGGTLLGSYRHHDMIPWDDDLDLLVREKDKDILKECLSNVSSEFELNTKVKFSWKLSHKDSIRTKRGWKWPFLDIFFYREDDTKIWDIHPTWKKVKYEKTDIFPLIERPLLGMMLPAPRNTKLMLSKLFKDLDRCKSNTYNHKKEASIKLKYVTSVPCDLLKDKFPFVRRVYTSNETIEFLDNMNNDTMYENYTNLIVPN